MRRRSIRHPQRTPAPRRRVQAKLAVGAVGDRFEHEADSVAATVMSSLSNRSAQTVAHNAAGQTAQRQPMEEEELQMQSAGEEEELQMQSAREEEELQMAPEVGAAGGALSPGAEAAIEGERGGGSAIAAPVRRAMESAFGSDFSGVRVHTGGTADAVARTIGASAFTTGRDMFFRGGRYRPDSPGGQRLIAHELTHVVQQTGAAATSDVGRKISRKLA